MTGIKDKLSNVFWGGLIAAVAITAVKSQYDQFKNNGNDLTKKLSVFDEYTNHKDSVLNSENAFGIIAGTKVIHPTPEQRFFQDIFETIAKDSIGAGYLNNLKDFQTPFVIDRQCDSRAYQCDNFIGFNASKDECRQKPSVNAIDAMLEEAIHNYAVTKMKADANPNDIPPEQAFFHNSHVEASAKAVKTMIMFRLGQSGVISWNDYINENSTTNMPIKINFESHYNRGIESGLTEKESLMKATAEAYLQHFNPTMTSAREFKDTYRKQAMKRIVDNKKPTRNLSKDDLLPYCEIPGMGNLLAGMKGFDINSPLLRTYSDKEWEAIEYMNKKLGITDEKVVKLSADVVFSYDNSGKVTYCVPEKAYNNAEFEWTSREMKRISRVVDILENRDEYIEKAGKRAEEMIKAGGNYTEIMEDYKTTVKSFREVSKEDLELRPFNIVKSIHSESVKIMASYDAGAALNVAPAVNVASSATAKPPSNVVN